nr:gamma-glutamyltransferase [Thalassobacillus sp. CUG 92003]
MDQGGSAVDAAIAVSYMLGVVEPYGSGIGGGGGMLVMPGGENSEPVSYQYRETVPKSGIPDNNFGVPGIVKGMEAVHEDYGTMEMSELIQPAIEKAEEGFKVDKHLTNRLEGAAHRMRISELETFFPEGEAVQPNDVIVQQELADNLKKIQSEGSSALYSGSIGKQLAQNIQGLEQSDLGNFQVEVGEPSHGTFAGMDVYSAPPPLSGTTLIQSLQMAETLDIASSQSSNADYMHLIGEISKRAYDNRLDTIGDPNFIDVPKDQLTSQEFTTQLADDISMDELSQNYEVDDSMAADEEHTDTTHFVVVDENGQMVSATHTLSNFFGSGQEVGGFFLNDQLKNFSADEDSPNSIEIGKSPRSFMSPTILRSEDRTMGLGSPGGSRIPMILSQVLTKHLIFDEPLENTLEQPRFYIEDDSIFLEEQADQEVVSELESRGYNVYLNERSSLYGGVQTLIMDKAEDRLYGGADPRRSGRAIIKQSESSN